MYIVNKNVDFGNFVENAVRAAEMSINLNQNFLSKGGLKFFFLRDNH